MHVSAADWKLLVVVTGIVAAAIASVASIAAIDASHPAQAATKPFQSFPEPLGQYNGVPLASAELSALQEASPMGPGARILSARLLTFQAASKATGTQIGNFRSDGVHFVWLVWIRGTFQLFSCVQARQCPAKPHTVFWVAVDLKTGVAYANGWSRHYPAGYPG